MFARTAVKRTGRDRFLRNVLIAIGNSGDAALAADAERLLDGSGGDRARGRGVGAGAARLRSEVCRARGAVIGAAKPTRRCGDEWAAARGGGA